MADQNIQVDIAPANSIDVEVAAAYTIDVVVAQGIGSGLPSTEGASDGDVITLGGDGTVNWGPLPEIDPLPQPLDTDDSPTFDALTVNQIEVNDDAFIYGNAEVSGAISGSEIHAGSAMFGFVPMPLRAFNIRGQGLDGRISLQGFPGDNPGLELTTNNNYSRVLLRMAEVGTFGVDVGTELQIYTEPEGGSIAQAMIVRSTGDLDLLGHDLVDVGDLTATGTITVDRLIAQTNDIELDAARYIDLDASVATRIQSDVEIWGDATVASVTTSHILVGDTNEAGEVPLTVQAASGQTADVFRVEDAVGSSILSLSPEGMLSLTDPADGLKIWEAERIGGNNFWRTDQTTQFYSGGGFVLRTESYANITSDNQLWLRGGSDIYFQRSSDNADLMRLKTTTGDLLIGTTTDTGEKLQVAGTAKAAEFTLTDTEPVGGQLTTININSQGIEIAPARLAYTDIKARFTGDYSGSWRATRFISNYGDDTFLPVTPPVSEGKAGFALGADLSQRFYYSDAEGFVLFSTKPGSSPPGPPIHFKVKQAGAFDYPALMSVKSQGIAFGHDADLNGAFFNVESPDPSAITARFKAAVGQTADIARFEDSTGNPVLKVTANGSLISDDAAFGPVIDFRSRNPHRIGFLNITYGSSGNPEISGAGGEIEVESDLSLQGGLSMPSGGAAYDLNFTHNRVGDFGMSFLTADGAGGTDKIMRIAPSGVDVRKGSLEVTETGEGVILSSPNGTRFRITVDDVGDLTTAPV